MAAIPQDLNDLESRVTAAGQGLLQEMRRQAQRAGFGDRWLNTFFARLMGDERFRVQALRFVDVLPALEDDADLVEHLRAYFPGKDFLFSGVLRFGLRHLHGPVGNRLIAGAVRAALRRIARRFIGGGDAAEALDTAAQLAGRGLRVSLDLLGEAAVSEQEARDYQRQYLALLSTLKERNRREGRGTLLPGLSIKASSLYSQMNSADPHGSAAALAERLLPILIRARDLGVPVCLDMEQYDLKEIILEGFKRVLLESTLRDWPDAGIALQAYLVDAEQDLHGLIAWCRERGAPVSVRLVRGAYWDYETVIARQNGWPIPVWTRKRDTDLSYERCLRLLLEHHSHVRAAIGTHNARSIALAHVLAQEMDLAPDQFEYQMLYGMAPYLEQAVAGLGHPVRIYLPYGELIPGMAYLTRRLLENSSGQSFVRMSLAQSVTDVELLAQPAESPQPSKPRPDTMPETFCNEPPRRFVQAVERGHFAAALDRWRGELRRDYPLVIDGKEIFGGDFIESVNPARPAETVGRVAEADRQLVDQAVAGATRALAHWAARSQTERSALLVKAARLLHDRRDEFAALEVLEAGKIWREADADVAEAIDYLNYYAREALRIATGGGCDVPGETNAWFYRPRGVGAIIPPWNFPLAILAGMLSAAIVTGNTAILKPSSLTPVIAARFVALLREAGVPDGVVQFLAGSGESVGDSLVRHPGVQFIAFTGSLEVGRGIIQKAAELAEGQAHIKHVIAEMGGKNAIIVDGDADLDDAVPGVVQSAFGFQGQKCSACSRVIVVGKQHARFLKRLVEAARSLAIGDPRDPGTVMGPVISAPARARIERAIENGQAVADLVLRVDCSHLGEGYFVGPAIFDRVPPDSFLAQEEIFGPVLSVIPAADYDEALRIANRSKYALTGGLYSRHPGHIELASRELQVGNLYINRRITGALVGRQPFGGFRLSGLGSKAGGPDYLLHFVLPRTVTENTLRRGYAPSGDIR